MTYVVYILPTAVDHDSVHSPHVISSCCDFAKNGSSAPVMTSRLIGFGHAHVGEHQCMSQAGALPLSQRVAVDDQNERPLALLVMLYPLVYPIRPLLQSMLISCG